MKYINCNLVQQNLFNYHSKELTPELKDVFDDHIRKCAACSKLLKEFLEIEGIIEQEKDLSPSPFITTRIIQRLEHGVIQSKLNLISVLRPVGLAAAVLLAVLIGYGIGKISIDQSYGNNSYNNSVENLKTDLFIHDFIDENITIINNE